MCVLSTDRSRVTRMRQSLPLLMMVFLALTSLFFVHVLNKSSVTLVGNPFVQGFNHYWDNEQYARLGDAIIHGHFWLDLPVPDELLNLSNPYDFAARSSIGSESCPIFWDHAFYNGRYYCYFGVVPALLFFIPYQFVTGRWLSTPNGVLMIGAAAILSLAFLSRNLIKLPFCVGSAKKKHDLSLEEAVVFSILVGGSNVFESVFASRVYAIPVLSSVCVTALGLSFWFRAKLRLQNDEKSHLSLFIGSILMMLNLGCRPQFMVACFIAFPLFWQEIVKTRRLFSRKGMGETLCAVAPIPIVAAPLLAYNYIRFGSIIDFGAYYNLTGFDMTSYLMSSKTFSNVLYSMTIQPPSFSSGFPFIQKAELDLSSGWAPADPTFGGYFILVPISLLTLALPFLLRRNTANSLWAVGGISFLLGIVVLLIDCKSVGASTRYFGDFGLLIMLCVAVNYLGIEEMLLEINNIQQLFVFKTIFNASCICLLTISSVLFCFSLFSPGRYDGVYSLNPDLWNEFNQVFSCFIN